MQILNKENIEFETVYLPLGVETFDLAAAEVIFEESKAALKDIDEKIKMPDEMLLNIHKLDEFICNLTPDFLIIQNITFANAAYISEIIRQFECPILLWTLKEPEVDGGRLKLNSLTGAFSAGNTMMTAERPFDYIYGNPEEKQVRKKISAVMDAAKLKKALRSLMLLQIGHTPEGFSFGRADDREMLKNFGVTLKSVESRELMSRAGKYEDASDYLEDAEKKIKNLDKIEKKNVIDFSKLYRAYKEYCEENNIGALASRCWPDFFTDYGTPVCAVLALMNDLGIPSACEADAYGALTMYLIYFLTGIPAFFGDPVSLDEKENTITFWHCGTAPCSLAKGGCAEAGVHCNRKIGPTLEFGCRAYEESTILRIGKRADGNFRIFMANGEILDKPKQFSGTTIVVKTKNKAGEIVRKAVLEGWEPHFAVSYGDVTENIKSLGRMLNIEVLEY